MSNEPIENQWLKILEKYYDTAFIEIETMKIKYVVLETPKAIELYNKRMNVRGRKPKITAIMHITC